MVDRLLDKKVIGIKQCTKAIKNGEGKILYIAKDADDKLVNPLIELAKTYEIDIHKIETMKELGSMCGIQVGAAATVVLK